MQVLLIKKFGLIAKILKHFCNARLEKMDRKLLIYNNLTNCLIFQIKT